MCITNHGVQMAFYYTICLMVPMMLMAILHRMVLFRELWMLMAIPLSGTGILNPWMLMALLIPNSPPVSLNVWAKTYSSENYMPKYF